MKISAIELNFVSTRYGWRAWIYNLRRVERRGWYVFICDTVEFHEILSKSFVTSVTPKRYFLQTKFIFPLCLRCAIYIVFMFVDHLLLPEILYKGPYLAVHNFFFYHHNVQRFRSVQHLSFAKRHY